MPEVRLTKTQVKRVLKGLPMKIRKLKLEYINIPTAKKETCEDLWNKIKTLTGLKKNLEKYFSIIESGQLKQENRELKQLTKHLFGDGGKC